MENWLYFVGENSGLARVMTAADQVWSGGEWRNAIIEWTPSLYRASTKFTELSEAEARERFPEAFKGA